MSWTDVMTAIGTVASAGAAVGLGLQGTKRARRLDEQRYKSEEQRQATQVAAWMLVERNENGERIEVDPGEDPPDLHNAHVYVVAQNASDEPVWDVVIRTPGFTPRGDGSDEYDITTFEDERLALGPHELVRLPVSAAVLPYNRLPLEIQFRDNAGREWRRDDRGRLRHGRTVAASVAWLDDEAGQKK